MSSEMTLRLTGTAPLLMRNGRLADPLDPYAKALNRLTSKRAKTIADHEAIARVEWTGGLWLCDGRPCIPAEALESALVKAAKARRAGSLLRAALTVHESMPIEHGGPADVDELYGLPTFRHRCGVRIGTRTAIRTRPRFDEWRVTATLSFASSMIEAASVREIARHAGEMVGIGDWRPRFGRFRVDDVT